MLEEVVKIIDENKTKEETQESLVPIITIDKNKDAHVYEWSIIDFFCNNDKSKAKGAMYSNENIMYDGTKRHNMYCKEVHINKEKYKLLYTHHVLSGVHKVDKGIFYVLTDKGHLSLDSYGYKQIVKIIGTIIIPVSRYDAKGINLNDIGAKEEDYVNKYFMDNILKLARCQTNHSARRSLNALQMFQKEALKPIIKSNYPWFFSELMNSIFNIAATINGRGDSHLIPTMVKEILKENKVQLRKTYKKIKKKA